MLRRVLVASGLDPGVTVASTANLIGKMLEIFLGGLIVEGTANESLGGEDGVFRISDGLKLLINLISKEFVGDEGKHAMMRGSVSEC